ncbi:uncharacterized protein LOC130444123 [Diorhabda sublineata]|uniref:uncharacterized protein LOC130444123 n=1 Tax=Diorhabda sublineata TaxID=1163346 RepID=UPI0024E15F5C|nr:uncharacterized protein LOC130444123 [Diorhabda sublineata]
MTDNTSSFWFAINNGTMEEEEADGFGGILDYKSAYSYWVPFTFVVSVIKDVILSFVMIVVESFAIYLFCRFKKLRQNLNIYIFNMCFLDIFAQWKSIIEFFNSFVLFSSSSKCDRCFCFIIQMYKCSLALYYILSLCLALEWFVISYSPHFSPFSSCLRITFVVILNSSFLALSFFASFCVDCYCNWTETLIYGVYLIFILNMIILNILVYKSELKKLYSHTSYVFEVSNMVAISFFFLITYHIFISYFDIGFVFDMIILFTIFIPQTLAHIHFLMIILILFKYNIDVRNVLTRHFRGLEEFNDDQFLTKNVVNCNTYVHADNFGSVEDTRRISSFI